MGVQVQEITPGDGEYKIPGATHELSPKNLKEKNWAVKKMWAKFSQVFRPKSTAFVANPTQRLVPGQFLNKNQSASSGNCANSKKSISYKIFIPDFLSCSLSFPSRLHLPKNRPNRGGPLRRHLGQRQGVRFVAVPRQTLQICDRQRRSNQGMGRGRCATVGRNPCQTGVQPRLCLRLAWPSRRHSTQRSANL
jgi:hypothetical protein